MTKGDSDTSRILRLVIDSSNKYIAIALANGIICVRELNSILGFDPKNGEVIYTGEKNKFIRYVVSEKIIDAKDLILDPTHKWIAMLTSRELTMWDLRKTFLSQIIHTPKQKGNVIAFDNTGQLLALGTEEGITIYDTEKGKQIVNIDVGRGDSNIFFQ